MFADMVGGWFATPDNSYNEFIRAPLEDDVKKMNMFMNKVALQGKKCLIE